MDDQSGMTAATDIQRNQAWLDDERSLILESVDAGSQDTLALASWMASHPELALEEHGASARYRSYLEARGFRVRLCSAGLETAFVASWGSQDAPFHAALLAEMDALPEIGHACGHNLSGPASLLAAVAVSSVVPEDALRIEVVGCPAEQLGIAKLRLVEAGVFDGADIAMMAHASDVRRAHHPFLGNRKYEFVYHTRAAHAARHPERGLNALDGAIGLLRQQLPRDVRIHGIISEGGTTPNAVPERAAARIRVQALTDDALADAADRVVACAKAAAQTTGNDLEILVQNRCSPPMWENAPLADVYRRQLVSLRLAESDRAPDEAMGSSDISHVSRVVPTIHSDFPIGRDLELRTQAFADAVSGPAAKAGLLEAARALALSTHELARCPEIRAAVAAAHRGHYILEVPE
jgi:amidohydrolase